MYAFCPLPDSDVGPRVLLCDVEHTSFHLILVCAAAAGLFFACLVIVHVSASHVIADSTQELYVGPSV